MGDFHCNWGFSRLLCLSGSPQMDVSLRIVGILSHFIPSVRFDVSYLTWYSISDVSFSTGSNLQSLFEILTMLTAAVRRWRERETSGVSLRHFFSIHTSLQLCCHSAILQLPLALSRCPFKWNPILVGISIWPTHPIPALLRHQPASRLPLLRSVQTYNNFLPGHVIQKNVYLLHCLSHLRLYLCCG